LDARFELLHLRSRRIQLLNSGCSGGRRAAEAGQVEARVFEHRLVTQLVRLSLVERRLVGLGIDFYQHVSGVHVLPLGKIDLLDLPIHTRLDEHAVQRLHGSEAGEEDRNVASTHLGGDHGNDGESAWRRRRAGGELQAWHIKVGQASAGKEQKQYRRPVPHSVQSPLLDASFRNGR
jgi:hypothetical protein